MASPRVFILPSGRDGDGNGDGAQVSHTLLTLNHPNTNVPTRYLLHHPPSPADSSAAAAAPFLFEVIKVANPAYGPRSWLITPDVPPLEDPTELPGDNGGPADENTKESETKDEDDDKRSLVIKDAHLFLTTTIDPIYLLLSHLAGDKTSRNFLSVDDILEGHPESATWSQILKLHPPAQKALESRLLLICDTVSAGDDQMYRLNTTKLYDLLISRVEAVARSLPSSLLKLVNRKLSKPISAQATAATWRRQAPEASADGGIIDDKELEEEVLQETGESSTAAGTEDIDPADAQLRREASRLNLNEDESSTSQPPEPMDDTAAQAPQETEEDLLPAPEIQFLFRLTHAIQFMQSYLSRSIYSKLTQELYVRHPLAPLEAYQEELKGLRAAATVAMDMTISHTKRTIEDLEGGISKEDAEREKKRKKKEEGAKKSVGVRKLEKVNKQGMMKMTSFFKKKE